MTSLADFVEIVFPATTHYRRSQMKRIIGLVGAFAFSFSGAIDAHASPVWSGNVDVSLIEVSDTGGGVQYYLQFSAQPHSTSCSAGSGGQWLVGGSADNVKAIVSIATSAKLGVRPVQVMWDNGGGSLSCSGGGTTGYPIVRGLEIQ
jgi:hypothetical protein